MVFTNITSFMLPKLFYSLTMSLTQLTFVVSIPISSSKLVINTKKDTNILIMLSVKG